jgi:DNA-binding transcriptional LysR family regulator
MAELTPAGLRVLREVAACGSFSAAAQRDLARQPGASNGPGPRVRLGAFTSALAGLVPRALRYGAGTPGFTVTLREGISRVQLGRLAAGTIDVAVITGGDADQVAREHPGLSAEWLLDDPLLLAVGRGHPLAASPGVRPDELEHEPWIVGSTDTTEGLLGAWNVAGWAPQTAFTVRDWTAKLGLVAQGHGVTIVPGLSAPAVPPAITLVRILDPRATRAVLVARPAEASTADPAQAVVTALRAAAAGQQAAVRAAGAG